MVLLYERTLVDTLQQRVGVGQCRQRNCCSNSLLGRVWTRVINQGGFQRGHDIFHDGPDIQYNYAAVQVGADVYNEEYSDGSQDHIGILGAVGRATGKVRHFTRETAGRNRFNAYTGGFYCTHIGPSGWYVDGLVALNWYHNIRAQSSRSIPELKTHATGVAASFEGGYPVQCNCFTLEPQAQFVYQRIQLHDARDIAACVHFNKTDSAAGRIGARLANTFCYGCRQVTTWLRGSVWRDFQGNSRTAFSSELGPVSFLSKLNGSWFQGELGVTAQLSEAISAYGTIGGNVYVDGRGKAYNGIAGLKADF